MLPVKNFTAVYKCSVLIGKIFPCLSFFLHYRIIAGCKMIQVIQLDGRLCENREKRTMAKKSRIYWLPNKHYQMMTETTLTTK